jgi:hypothetical protein
MAFVTQSPAVLLAIAFTSLFFYAIHLTHDWAQGDTVTVRLNVNT